MQFDAIRVFFFRRQEMVTLHANQATEIFAGRDNHPFLSTLGASHFAFVFFTGLQPQVKLHLNISPHELMKTSLTEIVRRAQGGWTAGRRKIYCVSRRDGTYKDV